MKESKGKLNQQNDFGKELAFAAQKLIMERLGTLEDAVLLGNRLYQKPTSEAIQSQLRTRIMPNIQAKMMPEKTDLELGENFHLRIELENVGKAPVMITRIEDVVPEGFELAPYSSAYLYVNTYLDMHGMKLDPNITENVDIPLRSTRKGTFVLAPRIVYTPIGGTQISCKPEPASIHVSETILSDRIRTGFQDLDNLLFGGIPQNYAVILTSASCDERDLLIRRYMEAGAKEEQVIFCVTEDSASIRNLAEEFQGNFYALVCNPKIEETFEDLPNLLKTSGIENLTEVNIAIESMLRTIGALKNRRGRACLEILSDVLLQHHAAQTRKWLTGLIPKLRSRGFTTLAVMNPLMHGLEELHAMLELFEGEISIYEKEARDDLTKYLRIKKMYNQRYLENEMPLKKTRLMTMPLPLSCCTRAFNM